MANQHTMQDPLKQYPQPKFSKQPQDAPGLAQDMDPKPDHGETSYQGSGKLTGRKALITGADSGIGRATAIAFAREGADIALNYLESEEADAAEVIALIEDAGQKAIKIPGDIKDENFCKQLVETTVNELGGIDTVVQVAGKQTAVENIADLSTEQLTATFQTNVYSLFWISKAALPHMSPGSVFINTTSIVANSPPPMLLDYAATKAAISNFTHSFATQVIDKGIRVNAVAPGPIWTPLQPSGGQPQDNIPTFGENESAYGRPGQPAELAPAYVFLASQESSYITGEIIGVSGGSYIT